MKRALLVFTLFPLAVLAEPATVLRSTELKQEAATDSATLAQLAENTAVDAVERRGGWVRVKAGPADGWVKMLALRYGAPGTARQGDTGLSQIFNVARTGSSGTQVTTGVRGLEAEQIANAQPNAAELKKMQGFSSTADSAALFAAQAKLQPRAVQEPR